MKGGAYERVNQLAVELLSNVPATTTKVHTQRKRSINVLHSIRDLPRHLERHAAIPAPITVRQRTRRRFTHEPGPREDHTRPQDARRGRTRVGTRRRQTRSWKMESAVGSVKGRVQ